MWLLFTIYVLSLPVQLTERQSCVKHIENGHMENGISSTAFNHADTVKCGMFTLVVYRGSEEGMCDDILGEIWGIKEDQVATFSGEISAVLPAVLPANFAVRDNIYRQGSAVRLACSENFAG